MFGGCSYSLVRGIAFEVGQAVLMARLPSADKDRISPVAGVVVRVQFDTVTVQTSHGRRNVAPCELIHRGYCLRCDAAAHVEREGALVCPMCGGEAAAPVPNHQQPEWEEDLVERRARIVREMLRSGGTSKEARESVDRHRKAVWVAMLGALGLLERWERNAVEWRPVSTMHSRYRDQLQRLAERGDHEKFEQIYAELVRATAAELHDLPGGLSRWSVAQPVVRVAEDSEPDGPDVLTHWLAQQFAGARG